MIKLPKRGCAPPLLLGLLVLTLAFCNREVGTKAVNMGWEPDSTIVLARNEMAPVEFRLYNDNSLLALAYDSLRIEVSGASGKILITTIPDTAEPPPPPPPPTGTPLADSFAVMQPGDWLEFPTNGLDDAQNSGGPIYTSVFDWAEGPAWDPVNQRAYMIGSGHDGTPKFIQYDARTNTWSDNWTMPYTATESIHGVDENAFISGNFYRKRSNIGGGGSEYIYRWDGSTWTELSFSIPLSCCGAIFDFPGLGQVLAAGDVYVSTDLFQTFGSSLGTIPGRYNFAAEYSAVQNRAVFIGGENNRRSVNILDQQGNFTAGTDAPVDVTVATACLTVDPVSGLFYLMYSDLYSYNAVNDVWQVALTRAEIPMQRINPNNQQPIANGWRVNAFPAYNGIVWLFSDNWSTRGNMWLWKP